jgi:hypothetical protein
MFLPLFQYWLKPAIEAPEPLPNPVIVPAVGVFRITAVQVNVVPVTVGFSATLVTEPQTVCALAEPVGLGLTVMVPLNELLAIQVPAVVMV